PSWTPTAGGTTSSRAASRCASTARAREGEDSVSVDVLNETDYQLDELELVALSRYVMGEMRVHPGADLCLRLVDEAAMEVLHVQWMDLPGPTDVMSFPMDELRPGREGEE